MQTISKMVHVDDEYRDNPGAFQALRDCFNKLGFEVIGVANFDDACTAYKRAGCPEPIIMDVMDIRWQTAENGRRFATIDFPGIDQAEAIEQGHPSSDQAPTIVIFTALPADHDELRDLDQRLPELGGIVFKNDRDHPERSNMDVALEIVSCLSPELQSRIPERYRDS